ncbi:MAG: hypothetical protein WCG63_07895 [Opitutaceae bacterium]
MKWVALVIVVSLAGYTYVTLRYRKTTPSYLPYQDTKNRAGVLRLLSAGFQRIILTAQRPAEAGSVHTSAASIAAPGGLGSDLGPSLLDLPLLPAEITRVYAPASVSALLAYPIEFTCTLADNKRQLSGAELYLRDNVITLLPTFEQLDGGLMARSRDSVVLVTIPAGTLKPGAYRAVVVGEHTSRSWTVQVH